MIVDAPKVKSTRWSVISLEELKGVEGSVVLLVEGGGGRRR